MAKKVLVISHERSGTHWLMDTITSNFLMPDPTIIPAHIDLDQPNVMYADPDEMKSALQYLPSGAPLDDMPYAHPFKSHHPFEFFAPIWDYVLSQYHVFYIARDGRDVMVSFWRHCWKASGMGPRTFNANQFMDEVPVSPMDRYHGETIPCNITQRWSFHINSWMRDPVDGVHYVTYEDMHKDFSGEVKRIGEYVNIAPPERIYSPKVAGVTPWKGITGSWKEFLDEDRFWPYGNLGMMLLGYEVPMLDKAGKNDHLHDPTQLRGNW